MKQALESRLVRIGIGCFVAILAACFALLFLNLLAAPRSLTALLLTPPLDPGFVRVLDQTFSDSDYLNLSIHAVAAPAKDSAAVEYGVLFWHGEDDQGREHFLGLTVSSASNVHLFAYEPITSTQTGKNAFQLNDILPPTFAAQIRTDGSPNDIRVDVHPRRLLAYVNDELVLDTD